MKPIVCVVAVLAVLGPAIAGAQLTCPSGGEPKIVEGSSRCPDGTLAVYGGTYDSKTSSVSIKAVEPPTVFHTSPGTPGTNKADAPDIDKIKSMGKASGSLAPAADMQ